MKKISKQSLALLLAFMMLIPSFSFMSFAAEAPTVAQDFESFSEGKTLTTEDGFTVIAPVQKVIVENDNHFLRLPFACTDPTSSSTYKTGTTNAGKYMQLHHNAFSTTKLTSIKVDLRIHGEGGTTPNAGVWLRRVNYTNTSGASATEQWFQLFNVNLLTGEMVFDKKYNAQKANGAIPLTANEWNTVEVLFNPADGSFEVYVKDVLYASCTSNVAGTNFTVGANVLMYAINGTNSYNTFSAIDSLNASYSNCNYMDADNFTLQAVDAKPLLNEGFERFAVGTALTTANGFVSVAPIHKLMKENGNTFLRMPIAANSLTNLREAPTNRAGIFQFNHAAFSTTAPTSISVDLRMNGVSGTTPNVGVWIRKLTYTNTAGTAGNTKEWVRLFDVDLLTGELLTRDVNGTTTGARGLIAGEWNKLEVVFDPLSGAFDIYVNDTLYKQCTAIVEGSKFVVPANSLMFAVCSSNAAGNYTKYSDLNETYSNSNYMDADNFKIVASDRALAGRLYYSEAFNSYTPGTSVALGTTPGATSTYEKDPTNELNVAVKVPFGAKPDNTEILMRMNGTVPVENGWYAVTRNAETNAVEVDGMTVTLQANGKYTVSDGTNTYTDLELTVKETYYAYWGADGVIDQNWQLPSPEISYTKQASVVISVDYYISSDAYGKILAQMRNYASNGTGAGWLDLFYIDAGNGTIAPKGGSTYTGINKGEWNNVMLDLDLQSGVGKVYVNGKYVGNGTYPANLTLTANKLMVAKMNRKYSSYKDYAGYFMVDNVKLMSSTSSVTVDADRLLYVEVDGRKIYNSTFNLPEGSSYNAVYLKDEDYAGIMTTELFNSIRLSTASGMRFATRLDMTLVEALYRLLDNGDLADVTFGTLIAPADYISSAFTMAQLDADDKHYLKVDAARDAYFTVDEDESTTHFVGSIANFYASNISRSFAGRGYVRITFRSGQEIVLYSAVTQTNSVKTVAQRVMEDTDYFASLSAQHKEIVETYAEGKAPAVSADVAHLRKLNNLNVLAIGDSLFHGDDVGYKDQWIARLAKQHNWNLTNLGRNGWTIAYDPSISTRGSIYNNLMNNADFAYGTTASTYYTYGDAQSLTASDVDLILLEGGNNDCGARLPMGTIDSRDPSTLMGATNLVVDKLLTTYPNATVVLITSWHVNSNATENGVTYSRMNYAVNFMKQLYEANYATNARVTIVDAGNPALTGVDMASESFRAKYSIAPNDSYHLNVEGMKLMEAAMPSILADALFVCDEIDGISVSHDYESFVCADCGEVDPLSIKDEDVTRVVCVGDSITAGGYWKNNMQGNLDSSYEVIGLGVSGSTGLASGIDVSFPKAYVNQPEHALSLRYNADVIVIMLGTNDSKPCNFTSIAADQGAQYTADMIAMIREYQAASPDATVLVALPATVYNDTGKFEGISEANVTSLIIPCLEAAAEATGVTVVDTHSATANAKEHFSDGVHPSDDVGRGMLAKAIADAILEIAQ